MKKTCIGFTIAAVVVFAWLFQKNATTILDWIDTLGLWAPLFFMLMYGVATLCFLPTMVLTLAGGALFGPVLGTLFNLFGAILGATVAFCISRHWLSHWFSDRHNPRINKLIRGVDRAGWKFVAVVRFTPIIPFNLVNYGFGITRIPFSHYLITTAITLVPMEIIYTYCGYAGMDLLISSENYMRRSGIGLLIIGVLLAWTWKWVGKKREARNKFHQALFKAER